MSKRFKKISEEVLGENPWSEYKHDKFEMGGEKTGDYYYLSATGCSMVIPVLPDGRIVMIVQYRYLCDKLGTEFPCGGREKDDSFSDTAKKELKEETGYSAEDFIKVGTYYSNSSLLDDETHVFIAEVQEQEEQKLDETEQIEVIYRRPDEIDTMVKRGEIWDGQTLASWAMVRYRFDNKEL